jgi:hypothetical protein
LNPVVSNSRRISEGNIKYLFISSSWIYRMYWKGDYTHPMVQIQFLTT